MYSLDNESGVAVMPPIKAQKKAPSEPQWFTEGGNGVAPTYPGADWFNIMQAELLNILTDAGITPEKTQLNQLTLAIRTLARNEIGNLPAASGTVAGILRLTDSINMASSVFGASAQAVKTAYDKASSAYTLAQGKQSPATTLAGYGITDFKVLADLGTQDLNQLTTVGIYGQASDSLATSARHYPEARAGALTVKPSAYGVMQEYVTQDKQIYYARNQRSGGGWSEWVRVGGDSLPVGAVLAFPRAITHPQGFLLADGSTFGASTYPDLYRVLGNSNKLPDLRRSYVGMTAYFATDNIPDGWIAFDSIRTQVTQERYPELYRYLVAKYGSINAVPKAEDRFIRNAGAGLNVGQTQEDEFKRHAHASIHGEDQYATSYYFGEQWTKGGKYPFSLSTALVDVATSNQSFIIPNETAENAALFVGGDETRPKSLVLKLCIKAKNSLDDVQFWIKAFGEVSNAGELDASKLAQDLQRVQAEKAPLNHTHRVNQIPDFNTGVDNRITQLFTYQEIGNFEVRKYPDGTMIQTYKRKITDRDINTSNIAEFNWAQAFIATPMVHGWGGHEHQVNLSNTNKITGATLMIDIHAYLSSGAVCKYAIGEIQAHNQTDCYVYFMAIGRWK
ncbi:tail fiber protein [Avibacterium avium]|uniref:tail fiber protein n=1 Tax=Avibacterium avium TaxID=751 RepID=UPI003BF854F7